jgi:3-deoxy-D-manno-octulosonate 8-phosphate phosphatase (KDO 8-P phosphatase)
MTSIEARARAVRLLTCDVDGVLTDGRVYMDDDGRESKAFYALDGVGLKMLADAGIAIAWITGSSSPAVSHRARLLDVKHVIQNAHDKLTPWRALGASLGIAPAQCAHIGDDLPDLPVLAECGFAVTVPHAPLAVRTRAHYVTTRDGGLGAVRELAELILAAQGKLTEADAVRAVPGFLPRG